MKNAGETLKNKRLSLGLSIEQVALKLRIHQKYIIALEENNFDVFDSKVIARGFLIKYCKLLDLDEEKILAFWRRDFKILKVSAPKTSNFFNNFYITPRVVIISLFLFFVFILGSFSIFQYYKIKTPPFLEIMEPKDGLNVLTDEVIVKGKTDKSSEIFLNNQKINVGIDGTFSEKVYLTNGFNKLSIKSINGFGVVSEKILSVYSTYEIPKNETVSSKNILNVKSKGVSPTFIEVKNDNKQIFSGYLLNGVEKSFEGENLFIYVDLIENIELIYNNKPVDLEDKEAGVFTKDFSSPKEDKE